MRELTEQEKREKCFAIFDKALKNNSDNAPDTTINNETNNVECLFDYCISNPPYQFQIGGKRHQVYGNFWLSTWAYAKSSVMIFPIGWQKSTGRASGSSTHKDIRADKSLISVDNYYEDGKNGKPVIFPGVGTSGVNIVVRDNKVNSDTVDFQEYGETVDANKDMNVIKYWSDDTDKIFKKLESFMSSAPARNEGGDKTNINGMDTLITGRNPFGLPGTVFNPINKRSPDIKNTAEKGLIAIVNKKPNQGGREILYVPNNHPKLKTTNIEKHKICWTRNGPWSSWRTCFYTEPNIGLSDAFLCAYFDTKNKALNFKTYFTTCFYRFCTTETATNWDAMRSIHRFVPNLTNVENPRTGLTGWDSDWTDEDLKVLLKDYLTEDDWEYIEKIALESDGGRK